MALGPDLFAPFDDCSRACLACVLDGHGGTGAVQYVAERFPAYLLNDLPRLRSHPAAAMRAALHRIDEELTALGHNSGTTVNAVLLVDNRVTVVNTGDCRCILYDWVEEKTIQVTTDHNLADTRERERVIGAGAELSGCGSYVVLPCPQDGSKLLGVTKALGHAGVKALQRSSTLGSLSLGASLGAGGLGGIAELGSGDVAALLSPTQQQQQGLGSPVGAGAGAGAGARVNSSGGAGVGVGDEGGPMEVRPPSPPAAPAQADADAEVADVDAEVVDAVSASCMYTCSYATSGMAAGLSASSAAPSAAASGNGMVAEAEDAAGLTAPSLSEEAGGAAANGHGNGHCGGLCNGHGSPNGHCNGHGSANGNGKAAAPSNPALEAVLAATDARVSNGGAPVPPPLGSAGTSPPQHGRSVSLPEGSAFARCATMPAHTKPQTSSFATPEAAAAAAGAMSPGAGPPFRAFSNGGGATSNASTTLPAMASVASSSGFMLTCEPDEFSFDVTDDRHMLLLGCDGVFDRMTNSEACKTAVRLLSSSNSCIDAAREVTHRACRLGSLDNITALVLRLGRKQIVRRQSFSVLRRTSSNMSNELATANGGSATIGNGHIGMLSVAQGGAGHSPSRPSSDLLGPTPSVPE
ncbi:hypothetical protein HYH03_011863 [Edaphochlamys debaryana]|uniref:PPM-type phosphatase domain-containing protein n=1 Tax=Edaphochlamys debaryana TaxID=47281 RepID=A0A836BUH6_9CHLO|nr:hypothetical protein HYH03_011863 [Edaphochlamys debaryana]|eukprot:KAG2489581.1 hypothetical protein HYH03_011863 [Edaphochlamys debaryana]